MSYQHIDLGDRSIPMEDHTESILCTNRSMEKRSNRGMCRIGWLYRYRYQQYLRFGRTVSRTLLRGSHGMSVRYMFPECIAWTWHVRTSRAAVRAVTVGLHVYAQIVLVAQLFTTNEASYTGFITHLRDSACHWGSEKSKVCIIRIQNRRGFYIFKKRVSLFRHKHGLVYPVIGTSLVGALIKQNVTDGRPPLSLTQLGIYGIIWFCLYTAWRVFLLIIWWFLLRIVSQVHRRHWF